MGKITAWINRQLEGSRFVDVLKQKHTAHKYN